MRDAEHSLSSAKLADSLGHLFSSEKQTFINNAFYFLPLLFYTLLSIIVRPIYYITIQ